MLNFLETQRLVSSEAWYGDFKRASEIYWHGILRITQYQYVVYGDKQCSCKLSIEVLSQSHGILIGQLDSVSTSFLETLPWLLIILISGTVVAAQFMSFRTCCTK